MKSWYQALPTPFTRHSLIFDSVPKSPLTNGRPKRSRLMLISWKWDVTPSHMDALILLDMDCIFMFFVLLSPPSTLSSLLESLQIPVKHAVRCKSQGSFFFLMGAVCLCNTRLPFVLVTDKITEETNRAAAKERKRGWVGEDRVVGKLCSKRVWIPALREEEKHSSCSFTFFCQDRQTTKKR